MDYLQTLPKDVLRQTALSLPPEDVVELIEDKDLDNILNENFWKDKLQLDFPNTNFPIKETNKNYYLLNVIISNTKEKTKLFENIKDFIDQLTIELEIPDGDSDKIIEYTDDIKKIAKKAKLKDSTKYKKILTNLRLKQDPSWPIILNAEKINENESYFDIFGEEKQPKQLDLHNEYIWVNNNWYEFTPKYKPTILKHFNIPPDNKYRNIIGQIYLDY